MSEPSLLVFWVVVRRFYQVSSIVTHLLLHIDSLTTKSIDSFDRVIANDNMHNANVHSTYSRIFIALQSSVFNLSVLTFHDVTRGLTLVVSNTIHFLGHQTHVFEFSVYMHRK
jgi:hypothetical protein